MLTFENVSQQYGSFRALHGITLHAKAGSGGIYTIVAKRLSPSRSYVITLIPFDKAGNRPQFSTVTNVRTQPRHPRLF